MHGFGLLQLLLRTWLALLFLVTSVGHKRLIHIEGLPRRDQLLNRHKLIILSGRYRIVAAIVDCRDILDNLQGLHLLGRALFRNRVCPRLVLRARETDSARLTGLRFLQQRLILWLLNDLWLYLLGWDLAESQAGLRPCLALHIFSCEICLQWEFSLLGRLLQHCCAFLARYLSSHTCSSRYHCFASFCGVIDVTRVLQCRLVTLFFELLRVPGNIGNQRYLLLLGHLEGRRGSASCGFRLVW